MAPVASDARQQVNASLDGSAPVLALIGSRIISGAE
jgi:hypothetical protein